ncbi:MAG: hypothetical protein B7Z16_18245 [Algoriphagus sp. 32-45-6]|nr:MAG: hypothetical protein B7Z16_18245 [Algoriphagus sp. 32-45-6]
MIDVQDRQGHGLQRAFIFTLLQQLARASVDLSTADPPGGDEGGHFGIVVGAAHVPLPDFIFAGGDVAHRHVGADALAHPFVEVATADAQAVIRENSRRAHGGFAAVAEAVEGDLVRLRERLCLEPLKNALVLAVDDAVEREAQRIELPLQRAERILATIRIVWGKGDEALLS